MKRGLLLVLTLFIGFSAIAASVRLPDDELHVRRLTVRDGLPSAYINKILQRHDGFVWVASKGGLSRFDGQHFTNYQLQSDQGVLSNDVLSLLEDNQQRLWVGTARGLFLFNDDSAQFQFWPLQGKAPTILSLYQDRVSQLWVGTDDGVYLLQPAPDATQQFAAGLEVKVMFEQQEQFWLGTKQGLYTLEAQTGALTAVPLTGGQGIEVRHQRIFDAVVTAAGIYLATDRDGVLLLDPDSRQVLRQWLQSDNLSSNSVWSVMQHNNTLWLGYFYNGISSISLDDHRISHYQHHPQISYSLPHDNISQLYIDRQQQLWVATTNGLAVTNLADRAIRHLGEYQQISNKHVWSVAQQDNALWFGTEDGLNRYDRQHNELTVYRSSNTKGKLPRTIIWSILPLQSELLLATNSGLLAFSPQDATVRPWPAPPWQNQQRITEVYSLRSQQDQLLLGYYDGYFAVYDLTKQQYLADWRLDDVNYVTDMLALPQGYLVATDNGLFQQQGQSLVPLAQQIPELAQQPLHITSLLSVNNQIWASTQDHGLLILQWQQDQWVFLRQLSTADGLAENQLRALAIDANGQVWLTGMKTLSQVNPKNLQVRRLSRYLHWLDMEFHANASLKQDKNVMAFGGNQGLIVFKPDALYEETGFPALYLTQAQLMTQRMAARQAQLVIPPDVTYYAFQFAALEFLSPERIRYQYKLQPMLNDWQPMLNNQLSLSSLPYGDYVLSVRATNADGIWNSDSTDISLSLPEPWYLTTLAKGIYALLALLLVILTAKELLQRFRSLKRVANHDALTALPNRRYFEHELQQRLKRCRTEQQKLALMFFDLNRFKQLNDSCGHEAGDKLLVQVAARLVKAIRTTDFAARLAGDEFVVILSNVQHQQELDSTVARISQQVCQQYQLTADITVDLTCSIGVSIFSTDNEVSAERLLQQADEAMYRSKQQQQRWCYYQRLL